MIIILPDMATHVNSIHSLAKNHIRFRFYLPKEKEYYFKKEKSSQANALHTF